MGFNEMAFDRLWTRESDFPTYEAHETKVREDMQYLFDSIKRQFNNHIQTELVASNLPFARIPNDIDADNIQSAIVAVNDKVRDVVTFNIPDGSITYAKLRRVNEGGEAQAVGTDAIQDRAVTADKIADYCITAIKFAPGAQIPGGSIVEGSITVNQMGSGSVNTNQIVNNAVNFDKLAEGAVQGNRILNGAVTSAKLCQEENMEAVITETIRNGAVDHTKIGSGEVWSDNIKGGAVTTPKIGTGAVTYEKTTGIQKQHIATSATLASGTNSWTVTVEGVTEDNTVLCTADQDSFAQWTDNRIRCVAQGENSLSFVSDINTTEDVVVNILILD